MNPSNTSWFLNDDTPLANFECGRIRKMVDMEVELQLMRLAEERVHVLSEKEESGLREAVVSTVMLSLDGQVMKVLAEHHDLMGLMHSIRSHVSALFDVLVPKDDGPAKRAESVLTWLMHPLFSPEQHP